LDKQVFSGDLNTERVSQLMTTGGREFAHAAQLKDRLLTIIFSLLVFVFSSFTPHAIRSKSSKRGVYDISVRSMNIDNRGPTSHLGKLQIAITLHHFI